MYIHCHHVVIVSVHIYTIVTTSNYEVISYLTYRDGNSSDQLGLLACVVSSHIALCHSGRAGYAVHDAVNS